MSRKIITTEETEEDKKIEGTLRPQYLKDYIGQEKIKSTLKIFIDAAKSRGEALDHVLFYALIHRLLYVHFQPTAALYGSVPTVSCRI